LIRIFHYKKVKYFCLSLFKTLWFNTLTWQIYAKATKEKLLSYNFVCVFIWLNGTDSVFRKRARYKLNIDKKTEPFRYSGQIYLLNFHGTSGSDLAFLS
jgi:hypothetical protein